MKSSHGIHDSRVVKTVRSLKKFRPDSAKSGNSLSTSKVPPLHPRTTLAPITHMINTT